MSSSAKLRRTAALDMPTDLKANAVRDISGALNILPADMFALYLKTKNFHWHVSGPHFRDYRAHRILAVGAADRWRAVDRGTPNRLLP
jgi:starvation-inducible DNA-binding protein